MSSMKRRIFMGKAKSGKSNILKIVSIVAAILVAVGIIAVFVAPLIPVRKVDESAYKKLDNNDVYVVHTIYMAYRYIRTGIRHLRSLRQIIMLL